MKREVYTHQSHGETTSWAVRTVGALLCLYLWGCGAAVPITVPPLTPDEIPHIEATGNYPHTNYRIEPGDTLRIKYPFHPEVGQQETTVQPDGKINAEMVGELIVAGMTTAELEQLLEDRTSDRLRDPEVVVSISRFAERSVYIAGEVEKPGPVVYRKDLTPLQAIIAAGGFRETAWTDSVILIRQGADRNPVARKLDLAAVIATGAPELLHLAPHDVVYVPKTEIAEANLWVKQHIVDLIPFFRGTGLSYGIGR